MRYSNGGKAPDAPKGGEGNTTCDKVFDAVWNNTFGKL